MVGSAQKNWPPYLAEAEATATENPADAGDASELLSESSLVVELNRKHEEVALGPGLECFWFPDTTYFFRVDWSISEDSAPRPPPSLTRCEGSGESHSATDRILEERQTGKRSRDGSVGSVQNSQSGIGREYSPRDDGSNPSGSRQRRRKEQDGKESGEGLPQEQNESSEVPATEQVWPEYP